MLPQAGVVAVEVAGGPLIPFRMGRRDQSRAGIPLEGLLPDASNGTGAHLKSIFARMGFSAQEMVALSGAHTLGRARRQNSGFNGEQRHKQDDAAGFLPGSCVLLCL